MSEAPKDEKRQHVPPARSSILRRTLLQKRNTSDEPQVARFKDHFSLQTPTSTVRFHDSRSAARVICNQNSQLVLEEIYDEKEKKRQITIKRMKEESGGSLRLLRATYVLFSAFVFGFLFVLSLQVIFFVILDLAVVLGQTDLQKAQYNYAVGVLFSLPLLIHGMASAMMLAGTFLKDTWKGHYLFNKFVFPGLQSYLVEWMFFLGFLGVPLLVMGGYLMSENDDWWEDTSFFWFLIIFSFFVVFILNILWYEARVFLRVVHDSDMIDDHGSVFGRIYACVLLRQRHLLSGFSRTKYVSFGSPESAVLSDAPDQASKSRNYMVEGTLNEDQRGVYTRLTQWSLLNRGRCKLFENLERPQRVLSIEEIIQRRPYLTTYTWSLERYFCKPRRSRYIGIIAGPGALTKAQIMSTFICSLLGLFLVYILLAAILVYHGSSGRVAAGVIIGIALLSLPAVIQPIRLYLILRKHSLVKGEAKEGQKRVSPDTGNNLDAGNKQNFHSQVSEAPEDQTDDQEVMLKDGSEQIAEATRDAEKEVGSRGSSEGLKAASNEDLEWAGFAKEEGETSTGIYYVIETFRVTQPTLLLCFIFTLIQALLFVIWPTISLYTIENIELSTLFLGIALASTVRYFTDSEVLLEELGGLSGIPGEKNEARNWGTQSRLSEVTASVGKGQSYFSWRIFYSLFTLLSLVFGGLAIGATLESQRDEDYVFMPGFHYEPQNSVKYAACTFDENSHQGIPARPMADYVFLALQAYRVDNQTANDLMDWFGPGNVVDRTEIAESFRRRDRFETSAAFYKLFSYETNDTSHAVVSIRGTHNAWDFLADFQIWGASISLQLVRSALPFGTAYTTPMLHRVSDLLSNLQSGTIERVSFYRSTSSFVRYVRDSGNYSSVSITGHSLGGGLALISGAQTGVQAIGISAPNALISRRRFDITPGDIERFTFNVIPDRDPVPMTDDPAKTIQRIECRAPQNERMQCHSPLRSLCEIMYTCGSGSRPVICECVLCMGYPEPTPNANTTISFQEACKDMKPCSTLSNSISL